MYVTWQILIGGFIAVCVGFSSICVAGGHLLRIIDKAKKPAEDTKEKFKRIDEKLDDDFKRIRRIEDQNAFMLKAISLLLQDDLVILNHLRTDNNTGEMGKQEQKVQEFLIERKSDV